MSKFEKIIGYDTIKTELMQICDMMHNKKIYSDLGAKLPRGLLLYGDPGLGKTLMANCFIAESGLKTYTVRRNKGTDDFVGEIASTFLKAKENAPSIVFLDDMDKFANEDCNHRDAEEYVAVQSGIDEIKDSDVFVLATANDTHKLPESLTRSGRFDRKIEFHGPTESDAVDIIKHYLSDKKVGKDVNFEDVAMMISYSSCAELETMINEAAINAAFARRGAISMEDIVGAVLRMEYLSPDASTKMSSEELRSIALHEAGHLVVCEVLCPGSVGIASIRTSGRDSAGGFIHRCKMLPRLPYNIMCSLAGKVAVELYYSASCAGGCRRDIQSAYWDIREAISENGTCGLGMIDVATRNLPDTSENMNSRNEAVVHAELERYMFKTRNVLMRNREFLEKAASALLEKETLLYSDIRAIRESVTVTPVEI